MSDSHHDKERLVHSIFQTISEQYDLMNDLESFGTHRLWKRSLVRHVRRCNPNNVLDIACGTGDISLMLATELPQAKVIGFDFSEKMLEVARSRAIAIRPSAWVYQDGRIVSQRKLQFVEGNAMALPFNDGSFDVVTISFGLRNMADYEQVVAEAFRVLSSGGAFFCLDASYPTTPGINSAFRLYFKYLLPTIANLIVKKPDEYRWLYTSIEGFLTKPQLVELFAEQGFERIRYRSFMYGAAAMHYGFKPDKPGINPDKPR